MRHEFVYDLFKFKYGQAESFFGGGGGRRQDLSTFQLLGYHKHKHTADMSMKGKPTGRKSIGMGLGIGP
jgi:hypothetical protein